MKNLLIVLMFTSYSYFAKSTEYRNKIYSIIRVYPKTQAQVDSLCNLTSQEKIAFWIEPSTDKHPVALKVESSINDRITKLLKKFDFNPKIIVDDLHKLLHSSLNNTKNSDQSDWSKNLKNFFTTWQNFTQIKAFLNILACSKPDLVNVTIFGKSYHANDLILVKVSKNFSEKKPLIMITGGIHPREWVSISTVLYFIYKLFETSNEYPVSTLLDYYEWWFVPVVNPDGYIFTHEPEVEPDKMAERFEHPKRFWRKTRSNDDKYKGICIGVDANRNWDFHWRGDSNNLGRCTQEFGGETPFSEPETKAIRDLIEPEAKRIAAYLDFHSYGKLWLLPYGYTSTKTPKHYELMTAVTELIIYEIYKVRGTMYSYGSVAKLLYLAPGGAFDWFYGKLNVTFSFAIELPGNGKACHRDYPECGFLLPGDSIIPIGDETWAGVKQLALLIRAIRKGVWKLDSQSHLIRKQNLVSVTPFKGCSNV